MAAPIASERFHRMECSGAVSGIPHRGAIHRATVDTLVGPLCRLVERRDAALVVGDQGVAGRTRADENGAAEEDADAAVSVGDDRVAGARSAREAEARRRCDDTAV